jgi:hypothetical protein
MTLAEELANKHAKRMEPDGALMWFGEHVIAAINEAIERCAVECDNEMYQCRSNSSGYTASILIGERIRELKKKGRP